MAEWRYLIFCTMLCMVLFHMSTLFYTAESDCKFSQPTEPLSMLQFTRNLGRIGGDPSQGKKTEEVVEHPFWNFEWEKDILADLPSILLCSVTLLISGTLCTMAGIGGNLIQVTVLMAAGGVTTRDAVPLSKVVVCVGSIFALIMHLRPSFQKPGSKPVISWESCRIAVPACLLGTTVGVFLNSNIPDMVLILLLTVILFQLTVWTGWNAHKSYSEEMHQSERLGPQLSPSGTNTFGECNGNSGTITAFQSPTWWEIAAMLALLLLVALAGILRELTKKCHDSTHFMYWMQMTETEHCEHPFLRIAFWGKVRGWTQESSMHDNLQRVCLLVPTLACLAYGESSAQKVAHSIPAVHIRMIQFFLFILGAVGSLTGVGGGVALSSFFIMLGHDPKVTVATSTTCVIFISASSAIQYIITNRVKMALAIVYSLANILASCIGVFGVHLLANTWARPSFIMAFICLSTALSFLISFSNLVGMFW